MLEIFLIYFCVAASKRFREAEAFGAGKYIFGVWGSFIFCIILGILAIRIDTTLAALLITAGYASALGIAICALNEGHRLKEAKIMKDAEKAFILKAETEVENLLLKEKLEELEIKLARVEFEQRAEKSML